MIHLLRSTLLLSLLLSAACGGGEPAVDAATTAALKSAMEADFQAKRYGVVLDTIESVTLEGSSATAVIRVSHKESTKLKPKWTVSLKKDGERWSVVSIQKK